VNNMANHEKANSSVDCGGTEKEGRDKVRKRNCRMAPCSTADPLFRSDERKRDSPRRFGVLRGYCFVYTVRPPTTVSRTSTLVYSDGGNFVRSAERTMKSANSPRLSSPFLPSSNSA